MAETRTEYAVQSTQLRHGRRKVVVEADPGRLTDRAWNEQRAKDERKRQQSAGLTPDAVLLARTVTVSDWYAI
ncbi:hypothetical protein [Nonomuraea sp. NPDC023979]|uniref:hypothetical protein n=1 Tax=Nonomuraea sp. NPDC023979 TaxID=3154796 RepID=UPI0033E2E275